MHLADNSWGVLQEPAEQPQSQSLALCVALPAGSVEQDAVAHVRGLDAADLPGRAGRWQRKARCEEVQHGLDGEGCPWAVVADAACAQSRSRFSGPVWLHKTGQQTPVKPRHGPPKLRRRKAPTGDDAQWSVHHDDRHRQARAACKELLVSSQLKEGFSTGIAAISCDGLTCMRGARAPRLRWRDRPGRRAARLAAAPRAKAVL